MPTYVYICKEHPEPLLIEKETKTAQQMPGVWRCPECQRDARRYYHQQTVYGSNGPTSGGAKMSKKKGQLS